MKKVLTLLVIIISCSLSAQVPNYIPTNGLIGWWPFEGNANDVSGNGNHGTVTGATLTTDRTGQAASAYLFNQNNSTHRIETPIVATPGGLASNFTTVMWVKPTRSVNTVNNSTACPGNVSVPMANSNQNWAIYAPNFGTDIGVGLSVGTNGAFIGNHANNLLVCRGRKSFSNTGFLFVAIVHSGNTVKLYVDGNLEDSIYNYCPTRLKKLSSTVILGDDLYSPGFSGIIDDFGVWNRALSTSEIVGVYQQNGCITTPSAPSANSPQYFCGSGTVGDILFNALTGSSTATYSIYANSTGGTPIPSTTSLIDGTTYYASQTINGCESSSRTPISVELQASAITASADSICKGDTVNLSVVPSSGSSFSIGSTGPAGGIVFYDKGSITNGWRYLEVASADFGTPLPWGCAGTNVPGTSTSIGSGQSNTAAILQYCSTVNIAARACDTAIINGYSDWYLPSRGDFILINQNLSPLGLGNFINPNSNQWNRYWTSSQIGPYAYAQDFTPVYTQITLKNDPWNVRPVRQFASGIPFSTYVWSTGDTTSSISVVPDSTTQYWVDITLNGNTCRYYHTVNTSAPVAPSGSAVQTLLCAPTVAQLSATGTSIQWYNVASGGTPLSTTDTLVDNTVYYASQTINGCESIDRLAVTAIVPTVSITASADSICKGDTVSLSANLNVNTPSCNNLPGSLSNGLSAWYPFCGNANDLSGNNRHGTVSSAQLTDDRFGNPQSAYSFDAFQHIDVPGSGSLNHYPLTISLWYSADSSLTSGFTNLFSKYTSAAWNGYFIGLVGGPNGTSHVPAWYIRNTNNRVLGAYGEPPFEQTNVQANTWYHYVFVVDQNGGKIYVNGQLDDTHAWTGTPGAPTSSFTWKIGGLYNNWFKGKIDDVSIWNRALTLSEIQSLYSITDPTYQWSTGDTTSSISVVPDSTTQYWVDITLNGNTCRYYHTVNTSAPVAPSGSAVQTLLCAPTVAQLSATGTSIQWYNVASGGTPLSTTDTLVDNTVYYASQTINGCESIDRLAVTAIVPTVSITASADSICKGDTVSLSANLNVNTPSCNNLPGSLSNGLLGWYPFCGNANDESGNGNHGTVSGPLLDFNRSGSPNSSYSFNGGGNKITINPPVVSTVTNEMGVSLWMKIDSLSPAGAIFRKGGNTGNFDQNQLYWNSGQKKLRIYNSSSHSTTYNITNPNLWNHLCWNLVDSVSELFINGVSQGVNNIGFPFNSTSGIVVLGGSANWGYIIGNIDDVGIWNRALTLSEIQSLYSITDPTYQWSTGDTTSSISVVPDSTTQYWVDITLNGNTCRYYHTVNTSAPVAPSGSAVQTLLCAPTVAQLSATGTSIQWYNVASGGTPLSTTDTLVDNTVYYASQTINGCESIDRLAVTAIVPTVSITASADSICKGDTVSLSANLNVNTPSCNNLPGSLSNGLSAWYPFCGNANDLSGNNRHGTVSSAQLTDDRFGNPQSAYSFDAFQHIDVPGSGSLNHYPLTISLWYSADSSLTSGFTNLFSKYTSAAWNGYFIGLVGGPNGTSHVPAWYIRNTNNRVLGAYGEPPFEQTNVQANTWYHYVFVVDQNGGKIYVNGQLDDTHAWTGTPGAPTSSFTWKIGGLYNNWFKGKIDDVSIWNRALTLSEIQSLYSITDPTYQWSTGDTTSSISVVPDSTTQYWVDITLNGNTCRYYHTVNTSAPVAPSGSAVQTLLCAPTVAQLSATGTSIQWYNVASGGTPLSTTDTLVDNTVYYASQTINGCESIDRLAVTAIVPTVSITASADSICKGDTVSLSASNVSINGLYGSVPYLNTAGNATFMPLDTAQWYYIAITKDNNNQAKIYKNGQLVFSGNYLPRSYSWSRLDLGAVYYTSYSNWFEGLIDEVRISNTVRSSSSISNYFASNTPLTSDNNTIGLWHFDQTSGSTISASTGTSGTVHNATWSSNGKFGNCLSYNGVNARARISQSIPTSNMTFEFWIKPKTYQGSWPVSWYGSYTAGFGINVNTTIPTYQWSTGDTTSSISVVPDSTTQYWVDITLNGNTCRYYKTITSLSTPSPTGSAIQTFCNTATVGDLLATGSSVTWYNTASGGLPLANSISLTDSTMYYASQVINGCPSETRLPVLVIVQSPSAPIGSNTQNFCYSATLSQIVVTGSNIKYYNSAVGGVALNSTSPMVSGSTYYLSQTINNCESSTRLPVSIIISNPTTPSGPFVQSFCDSASVSQLIAIGQGIVWYSAPTGGSPLVSSQNLINGATYYAAQTINGCESSVRMAVYVSIQVTSPPIILTSTQVFCNFAQVSQLSAVGTNLTWYSSFTGSNPLSLSDTLVNGTTYFVSQTINGCESQRSSVIAIVNTTPTPSGSSIQSFCDSAFVGDLLAVGSQINWYLTPTGGTALPNSTPLNSNTYYYASQTLNNCESNGRLQCLVLITPSPSYTLSINGGLNFCTNDSISTTFTLTGISPQNTTVLWRQNGLPYSTQNSINPTSPGYYDAVLTSLLGCTTIVPGDSIRVFSPPVVLIVGDSTLNVGDTSTYSVTLANANTAYSWTIYGGTILSGQGTNSIQVVWSGNGYVSLLGTNQGCTDVDSLFVSVSGIGLSFLQTRNIYLYPNPTYGTFIIGGMDNPYSATIYSMTGKAVRFYPIAPSVFDLNGLSAGEYQIVLTDDTGFIEIITLILQQ